MRGPERVTRGACFRHWWTSSTYAAWSMIITSCHCVVNIQVTAMNESIYSVWVNPLSTYLLLLSSHLFATSNKYISFLLRHWKMCNLQIFKYFPFQHFFTGCLLLHWKVCSQLTGRLAFPHLTSVTLTFSYIRHWDLKWAQRCFQPMNVRRPSSFHLTTL